MIKLLTKILGMDPFEFIEMDQEEQENWIEKMNGKRIEYSREPPIPEVGARGNPYLALRKFSTQDEMEEESRKLFGV